MKPALICQNFDPPKDMLLFIDRAIDEIYQLSPSDSNFEAFITKDLTDYHMTVSIHHPHGHFSATVRDKDLRSVIMRCTANIFTQTRSWWKSRFAQTEEIPLGRTKSHGMMFEPIQVAVERHLKPLRILVVDDDIESVTPLELCLERLGCTTFVVSNGFEAVHEIVSGDRVYDAVILDWNMPEMNGGQALLNAQKVISYAPFANSHWDQKRLPIITYSSRAREEIDIPRCKDFRHLDHWEKPVSYLHLLNRATETFARLKCEEAA